MVTQTSNNIAVAKGCLELYFLEFFMICLVMVQVLGKGILSSEEGAAYVGEVLLVILSGGK